MFKKVSGLFAAAVFTLALPTTSMASLIPLNQLSNSAGFDQSKKIIKLLDESPESQKKIAKMGLTTQEVKQRIAALNDQEIASHLKTHNQTGGEVIVISLGTVLLVVLILLILD